MYRFGVVPTREGILVLVRRSLHPDARPGTCKLLHRCRSAKAFYDAISNASCESVSKLSPFGRGTIADCTEPPTTWMRLPSAAMMHSCLGSSIEGSCHQVSLA